MTAPCHMALSLFHVPAIPCALPRAHTPRPAPRTGCPHAPAPRRNGAAVPPGLRPLRPCRVAQVARMRLRRTPPVPVQLRRPRSAKVLHFNELCSAPCQKARRRALFLVWYRHGWARRPSPPYNRKPISHVLCRRKNMMQAGQKRRISSTVLLVVPVLAAMLARLLIPDRYVSDRAPADAWYRAIQIGMPEEE